MKKKKKKAIAVVSKIGRPPMYKDPNELQRKIDKYFQGGYRTMTIYTKDGDPVKVPDITISDLVIYLGFCDRHSFYSLEKRPAFSHTIKKARTFIEREYETMLKHGNCTGAIFALKNFGWVDKQEVDHTIRRGENPKLLDQTDNQVTQKYKDEIRREMQRDGNN